MEEKIFELMEKMYIDLKKEIQHVVHQVTRLEHESSIKFTALFDSYKQLAEGQERNQVRVDRIIILGRKAGYTDYRS